MRAIIGLMLLGLVHGWSAPGQVKCSWDVATETNVIGYKVLWGLASTQWNQTNIAMGRLNNTINLQLPVGVSYLVVQSFSGDEESLPSSEVPWTNAPPLVPPKNFKVTAIIQASITPDGPWRNLAHMVLPLPPGGERENYRTRMSVEGGP